MSYRRVRSHTVDLCIGQYKTYLNTTNSVILWYTYVLGLCIIFRNLGVTTKKGVSYTLFVGHVIEVYYLFRKEKSSC